MLEFNRNCTYLYILLRRIGAVCATAYKKQFIYKTFAVEILDFIDEVLDVLPVDFTVDSQVANVRRPAKNLFGFYTMFYREVFITLRPFSAF